MFDRHADLENSFSSLPGFTLAAKQKYKLPALVSKTCCAGILKPLRGFAFIATK